MHYRISINFNRTSVAKLKIKKPNNLSEKIPRFFLCAKAYQGKFTSQEKSSEKVINVKKVY